MSEKAVIPTDDRFSLYTRWGELWYNVIGESWPFAIKVGKTVL